MDVFKLYTSVLCACRSAEALWYIAPIIVLDFLFPRRRLPVATPTLFQLAGEILAALVLYDALFFMVHLTLHRVRLVGKTHGLHA